MRAFGQSDVVLSDLGPDAAFRRGPRRLPAVGRGTRPTRLRSGAASARARRPRNAAAVSGERRRPGRLLDPCRCRDRPGRDCAAGNKGLQSTDARERSVVLRARRHRNSAPPPPERPACWRGNRRSAQLRADVSQVQFPTGSSVARERAPKTRGHTSASRGCIGVMNAAGGAGARRRCSPPTCDPRESRSPRLRGQTSEV